MGHEIVINSIAKINSKSSLLVSRNGITADLFIRYLERITSFPIRKVNFMNNPIGSYAGDAAIKFVRNNPKV